MNRKFAITLLSSPVLFASILSMAVITQPARANQTVNPSETRLSCVRDPHSPLPRMACTRVSTRVAAAPEVQVPIQEDYTEGEIMEMNFTIEESDSAIALFGCDCPQCLNALRKMRGQAPLPV